MLQTKNLVKIYKPKRGVPVIALDKVSLTFPEKGMVFLLGKSGSGKSTLLNVLGGLDRYDSGDITIMGKSTKKFKQSHFDSYRNTYVGFIFQEYNILDEFSVGTNIALALQLQGIKPSTQKIHEILKEVDLEGYGVRKPNELSGGQKQRVAIARALVKNPKIIMADEPTGALDSTTGRQVLNTLKKLSRDKLVIVVSHDREFAEQYADRIVELADGRVIRDVERQTGTEDMDSAVPVYLEDSVSLPENYQLTESDRNAITKYIQNMIDLGKQPRFTLFSKRSSVFQPTDETRIPVSQAGYKLIKSRLPLKYAFKMGASGLKHKKFRLVMTIFLSCIALGLFGLANTAASYDYADTAYKSLSDPDNRITYATFQKDWTNDELGKWGFSGMTEEDVELIRDRTGLNVRPVYDNNVYLSNNIPASDDFYMDSYYMTDFRGIVTVDADFLQEMGATLVAGKLPESDDEAAVSTAVLNTFRKYGYLYTNYNTGEKIGPIEITDADSLIGLRLWTDGGDLEITGVVDTGLDMTRYQSLQNVDYDKLSFAQYIGIMALQSELSYARSYSLTGMLMVSDQFRNTAATNQMMEELSYYSAVYIDGHYAYPGEQSGTMRLFSTGQATDVVWLDGNARTELAADEIVVSVDFLYNLLSAKYGYIPEQYDFYYIQDQGGSYRALQELALVLEVTNNEYAYYYDYSNIAGRHDLKIVGVVSNDYHFYVSDDYTPIRLEGEIKQTLAPMPTDPQGLRRLVEFSAEDLDLSEKGVLTYNLMNPVTFELKNLDEVFLILSKVFFWIGLVFVIFASLLFSNFIATSISYKKQEIGILRAIGSRSNDVFRIFFAESFIIAMINFVLSFSGTAIICWFINTYIKKSTGILLTVLNVGSKQFLLLFAVCLLSAFVASWLPVYRIASKRPIDAIRDR